MGLLKTQSTLTLAVWASILIHTAGFLGFELAFSNREKSFPKSEPRTVSIVSISLAQNTKPQIPIEDEISLEETPLQNIELPAEIIKATTPVELISDNISTNKQEDRIPASGNSQNSGNSQKSVESGDGGLIKAQDEVFSRTDPAPLTNINPGYPFRARKKGFEGVVVLEVVISKSGEPVSCQIIDTSGYEDLDDAAKKTVLASRFYPGTLNGENIESSLRISIRFQLNKS